MYQRRKGAQLLLVSFSEQEVQCSNRKIQLLELYLVQPTGVSKAVSTLDFISTVPSSQYYIYIYFLTQLFKYIDTHILMCVLYFMFIYVLNLTFVCKVPPVRSLFQPNVSNPKIQIFNPLTFISNPAGLSHSNKNTENADICTATVSTIIQEAASNGSEKSNFIQELDIKNIKLSKSITHQIL